MTSQTQGPAWTEKGVASISYPLHTGLAEFICVIPIWLCHTIYVVPFGVSLPRMDGGHVKEVTDERKGSGAWRKRWPL